LHCNSFSEAIWWKQHLLVQLTLQLAALVNVVSTK